jgi:hypothetical protein
LFELSQREIATMTRLPRPGSRSPIHLHELSEEDRATYRRWARGWYVCGSIFIAGLLAVGLSGRAAHFVTGAQPSQTVGIDFNAKPARQPHPGG